MLNQKLDTLTQQHQLGAEWRVSFSLSFRPENSQCVIFEYANCMCMNLNSIKHNIYTSVKWILEINSAIKPYKELWNDNHLMLKCESYDFGVIASDYLSQDSFCWFWWVHRP